ncbi:MAG: recombinase family protein [Chloroflexi bacterium]|nr:recombinase family protein [Chloroflexota bacterium]
MPKPHDEVWRIRDKEGNVVRERAPTHQGLLLAFEMAARGESDKAIARALNEAGHRTCGTHGSNPFSKDTVRDMLQNRFYVGELPDGRSGWVKGRHGRIIPPELFEAAQEARSSRRHLPQTMPGKARHYSLSGVARCATCGNRLRVSNSLHPHLACARRLDSGTCREKSAGLGRLESQMAAYLKAFKLPQDYQEKMLALCHDKQPEAA